MAKMTLHEVGITAASLARRFSLALTFPDARVVVLHRNPLETIPSGASLTYRSADFWDKSAVGPIRLEVYSRAARRMAEARARHPGRCLDISYRDFVVDPIGTVHSIYAHYAIPMSDETSNAMRNWLAENPQGKHGKHAYSAEEFGITDAQIRNAFADYIAEHELEH